MSLEQNDQSQESEQDQKPIVVESEDFEIQGVRLQKQNEAIAESLDSKGRKALEILLTSPYEEGLATDRVSLLGILVKYYQNAEIQNPGCLDEKLNEASAKIIEVQKEIATLEKSVEKYSDNPNISVTFKGILDQRKDLLKSQEAFLKAMQILKGEEKAV
ncbi:TPA: hypothetical protein DD449_03540 [Candidatus Berkelbacteria bacterium]|uniref:Uncharacterized protein n=1 Tax=Berkelbacteria bacterium GW2011_GWE1_39_12 TaxID=1618337 RepID=A0A0G4B2N7_9BACT|nr:MAG: hypothetical protein UT28_C0001G0340 [Berkelbacteria bacterium GW2011_GWE1_39_12]HBO60731.1 hypothetical protein [Candidatus Berkelbacteria bacterium]